MTRSRWLDAVLLLVLCMLAACREEPVVESGAQYGGTSADHALSMAEELGRPDPGVVDEAAAEAPEAEADSEEAEAAPIAPAWDVPVALESGRASLTCDPDYAEAGNGEPLASLSREDIEAALAPCVEAGALRLHYRGKIGADFTSLVERVTAVAGDLGVEHRVLDLDSSGGQIEQAIVAGDLIAESGWTIWVREGAVCHSACVLVLAAGDMRMIAGAVGVHRMLRIGSAATSRAELNQELQAVYEEMKRYLQRNGAAVAVADLMMTVPNHSLRLLTPEELDWFGLAGRNAAEEDLQRIELARRCGDAFVRRKDAFFRTFDARCASRLEAVEDMNECGLALRDQFGFPDEACPDDGPLLELDAMPQVADAGLPAEGSGGDQP